VKAHNNNSGNELADQLAKEAACDGELDIAYNKYPKSAVISELKELGQQWQSDWDSSNKGALTKTFFPKVKDRLAKRLQMCLNLSTVITGHGKLRAYLHRFKIIDDPMCPCEMNPRTTDHLIRECTLFRKQRQRLKNSIIKASGSWPISNTELANTYTNIFQNVDVFLTVHLSIFISVFQLDAQNLFHNKFYFMPLHVSSTCARNM